MASKITFDSATGELVLADGSRHSFLPVKPANSPPYEFIVPDTDPSSEDGASHYLIGGDPALVKQIVDYYAARKTPVPDGYAAEAARHADAVRAELAKVQAAPDAPTA